MPSGAVGLIQPGDLKSAKASPLSPPRGLDSNSGLLPLDVDWNHGGCPGPQPAACRSEDPSAARAAASSPRGCTCVCPLGRFVRELSLDSLWPRQAAAPLVPPWVLLGRRPAPGPRGPRSIPRHWPQPASSPVHPLCWPRPPCPRSASPKLRRGDLAWVWKCHQPLALPGA